MTDPTPRDPVRDLLAAATHEATCGLNEWQVPDWRHERKFLADAERILATPSGKALAARVAAADESSHDSQTADLLDALATLNVHSRGDLERVLSAREGA